MKGGHGQRAQCPANAPQHVCSADLPRPHESSKSAHMGHTRAFPIMRVARGGADKKDYCCSPSCVKLGGPRQCTEAGHTEDLCLKSTSLVSGCGLADQQGGAWLAEARGVLSRNA